MTVKETSRSISFGILRAVGLMAGIILIMLFLWEIQSVLAYVGIAAVLSLIGRPIVRFLRNTIKLPNMVAVIITLITLFCFILGVVSLIIPVLIEQGDNISKINVDEVRSNLEILNTDFSNFFNIKRVNLLERAEQVDFIKDFNMDIIPSLINSFFGTLGNLGIGLFSVMFITFFLLKDSRLLLEGILVFSKTGNEGQFLRAFTKIKELLSRYFIGLLFQVIILFVLYTVIMLVVGVENALIIAFFCALLNLIPYLGPAIGYLLMSVFVISDGLGMGFTEHILPKLIVVFVGYGIVQTIDNFLNQPLIFGKSVKSHPLEIFIVILVAGIVFGILGLVLAIPVYTAIKVISKEFLSEYKIVQKLTQNL